MRPNPTLGFALLLSSCVLPLRVDHLSDNLDFTESVTAIDVYTPTGDIAVQGSSDAVSHLTVDYAWHGKQPALDAYVASDGTLVVSVDCHDPSWYCKVDLSLTVPYAAAAQVETATGDISVRTLEGDVTADASTGRLLFTALTGEVQGHTSTGAVIGRQIASSRFVVETSTGDVDVIHDGSFTLLDAETSTGDIDLLVPAGTYDVTAETSTGSVELKGIADSSAADAEIRGVTSTGDVRITGYTVAPQ